MTVQISQIQSPEPGLFGDFSARNLSDRSFQQYLEQEQRRIGSLFSPFNQFNFSSWFEYSDFTGHSGSSRKTADYFSDLMPKSAENYQTNTSENVIHSLLNPEQTALPTLDISEPQLLMQDLLNKTGWLTPNLESLPQFFQAQLQGKMLNKLDLQFLVDQILSQVKLVKGKGKVELILGLKPDNLGEILLTLTSRSGMISIQIQAPEETRKLIKAELLELELALRRANVNLEEIKILALMGGDQNA